MTQHVRDWAGATALSGSLACSILSTPAIIQRRDRGIVRPRAYVRDGLVTYDQATKDSAGAFLIGELERLDPMIHEPLVTVTWQRDIDLRTDVQIGDEFSSFTQSTFGAIGSPISASGIAWASSETTSLPRAQLDIVKVVNPLDLWSMEVAYTVPELKKAEQLGRPIDVQQLTAMTLKHQMDADQLVYIGDSTRGTTGLVNNSGVTASNVTAGSSGSMAWTSKSPAEILNDFNSLLTGVWKATGYVAPPTNVLIAPTEFGYLTGTVVSSAGNRTIMDFLAENNVMTAEKGIRLDIKACKWLDKAAINGPGAAAATYDRMVAYTRKPNYVRFPMVPLIPMAPQFDGIWVKTPYYGRMGVVEIVYNDTLGYRDGIG